MHLKKIYFIRFYFKIVFNDILRTLMKSIYLKIVKKEDIFDYAFSKVKALLYFNKWVIKKNINTGYNPY